VNRRAVIAALASAGVLAGCGFRPLYGTGGDEPGTAAELQAIAIPEPKTRLEQLIRNDLLSAMRPVGTATEDKYTLVLQPVTYEQDAIVTVQSKIERKTVNVRVAFSLLEKSSGRRLYAGNTFSLVSYDRTGQGFADLQAQTNAVERAAHQISTDIRTRLAAHFAAS
jgi:LPS-assembly lipoprotein